MFKRPSAVALRLRVNEATYSFSTLQDFDFALNGRTGLPATKIVSLVSAEDDVLLKEAEGIRQVEKRFVDVLSGSLQDATSVGPFLKSLDLSLISQDHDWRQIISSINSLDASYEEFKKVALIKYMQYLTSRQEVVKTLYACRREHARGAMGNGNGSRHGNGRPLPSGNELKETVLFDVSALTPADRKTDAFSRLPKGETVDLRMIGNQTIELLLAKHRFMLTAGDEVHLVDNGGKESVLRTGKNIVGRDASADIVIDVTYRDVSRKHLIIEKEGRDVLKLTDISSLGTFVPPEYLDRTGV